jgi:hypothetical protein
VTLLSTVVRLTIFQPLNADMHQQLSKGLPHVQPHVEVVLSLPLILRLPASGLSSYWFPRLSSVQMAIEEYSVSSHRPI